MAALAALGGCRTASQTAYGPDEMPFEQMRLLYEVNGRYRDLPLGEDGVAQAHHQSQAGQNCWRSARLQLEYPHPDGMPGLARATLRLSAQSESVYTPVDAQLFQYGGYFPHEVGSNVVPLCDDEIWVLDVPRQQLDLLLADLNGGGFFQSQRRLDVGTRLDVQVNGGRTAKPWTAEPRLDDFVHRVHSEGRLSGFVTCGCELPDRVERAMANR